MHNTVIYNIEEIVSLLEANTQLRSPESGEWSSAQGVVEGNIHSNYHTMSNGWKPGGNI